MLVFVQLLVYLLAKKHRTFQTAQIGTATSASSQVSSWRAGQSASSGPGKTCFNCSVDVLRQKLQTQQMDDIDIKGMEQTTKNIFLRRVRQDLQML